MASTNKWMGVTLVATLTIGVGVGVLVDRVVLTSTAVQSDADDDDRRGGRDHRDRGRRMVERLRSGLDLTDEQVVRLEDVMERNHETAHEFWRNSRQEYEALRKQFRADIRELLTDEQQVKFDAMVAEYDEKRRNGERRGRDR